MLLNIKVEEPVSKVINNTEKETLLYCHFEEILVTKFTEHLSE